MKTQPRQIEEHDGGGDTTVAVSDRRAVRAETVFFDPPANLVEGQEPAFRRKEELTRDIDRTGDMAAPRASTAAPEYCPGSRASTSNVRRSGFSRSFRTSVGRCAHARPRLEA